MAKEKILIVEDDPDILKLIQYHLSKEGFQVETVATGEEALRKARSFCPNLMVLDLMLPGVDGLEVCRTLRFDPKTASIRIIMVTAKGEEADIVAGLELGADDYITKPFSPRILVARLKTVLRRSKESFPKEAPIEIHGIRIDPRRHEVVVKNRSISLTVTELELLHFLAQRPGWVFTRSQMVEGVHGDDYPVTDRSIDVQIVGLRKKLGAFGDFIETIRGVGYRLKE
jgi:two-component system phosphate regulon response regulator PhoB